jgi:bla regulator protein BlaR1
MVDTQLQDNNLQTAINDNMETTVQEDTKSEEPVLSNYLDVIGLIWIVGGGIMLLYIFTLNSAFYLSIRRNPQCFDKGTLEILEECKAIMKVRANIPVIYSEGNKPPFLLGIFKPKLIVPGIVFDKLSLQEKRYVFLHEIAHLKRKDILVNSLMLILKSIHWFNPIIWYSCYKMQEDCEIACDAKVLSCLEPVEYKRYGETAIDLLKIFSKSSWVPGTAGISGNGKGIKRRIHMIARFKKNSLLWTLAAVFLFLIVGFVSLTNSSQMSGLIPIDSFQMKPVQMLMLKARV